MMLEFINIAFSEELYLHRYEKSRKTLKAIAYKKYLREFVYGGMDGSITTFAVVAGAAGANLDSAIVIVLGIANLIADGFAMSVGSYLSSKSEKQQYQLHKEREYWEIKHLRESEVEELRDIFKEKGFEGELLEKAVARISENEDHWVDMMMKHELEMIPDNRTSIAIAMATFTSFILVGSIPLVVYVLDLIRPMHINLFFTSATLTGTAFILIGLLKAKVTETNSGKAVIETLLLGTIAASLAYLVGNLLESLLL